MRPHCLPKQNAAKKRLEVEAIEAPHDARQVDAAKIDGIHGAASKSLAHIEPLARSALITVPSARAFSVSLR
jgi:hypothetical protein